jgi:hypothetical protein
VAPDSLIDGRGFEEHYAVDDDEAADLNDDADDVMVISKVGRPQTTRPQMRRTMRTTPSVRTARAR